MATSSRDAKLTLSIESLGQENITKLEKELRRLADRVTVLRDGTYIGSLDKSEITIPTIIEMMVGRVIDGRYRVERRLARGGMATVYEALDMQDFERRFSDYRSIARESRLARSRS